MTLVGSSLKINNLFAAAVSRLGGPPVYIMNLGNFKWLNSEQALFLCESQVPCDSWMAVDANKPNFRRFRMKAQEGCVVVLKGNSIRLFSRTCSRWLVNNVISLPVAEGYESSQWHRVVSCLHLEDFANIAKAWTLSDDLSLFLNSAY